ncbi:type VI secretion system-associated protein TagF [Algicella marina]|nr:type VI secretion system-associated protein TagF [Algicella marina]
MPRSFGAYGKMPALGDFFRIELPAAFVGPFDEWIQRWMVQVKGDFGPNWNEVYNSAPIWRFGLAGGLAGPSPVIGVMMNSVDRVGRQFPLVLAAQLEEGECPVFAHLSGTALFETLECVALDALEDTMSREVLKERLSALNWEIPVVSRRNCKMAENGWRLSGRATNIRDMLAARFLKSQYPEVSVWSARVSETEYMVCHTGMPEASDMKAFLDIGWIGSEVPEE